MQRHWLAYTAATLLAAMPLTSHAARVIWQLPLAGPVSWDYLSFDAQQRRLFVSRGQQVDVVDVDHQRKIAQIDGTAGVHGIALAPALGRGFVSDGLSNSVTVFDLHTYRVLATVAGTGEKPDAIVYDPASGHVLTFNGKGHSFSVIDASQAKLIATVPLPGKPEFAQADGKGHVYVNLEDRSQLLDIDSRSNHVLHSWELAGCDSPSGLALDHADARLFSVCDNEVMVVTDAKRGTQLARVPIGKGPDAVVYDPGTQTAYSSNGESGTLTAVQSDGRGGYRASATLSTVISARTLALDEAGQKLYLSAATVMGAANGAQHPSFQPGSFKLIAVGELGNSSP